MHHPRRHAACLLLIVLWVRSLYCADLLEWNITGTSGLGAMSLRGRADFWIGRMPVQLESQRLAFGIFYYYLPNNVQTPVRFGFDLMHNSPAPTGVASVGIKMPYWFVTLVAIAVAVAPWFRWRFSLRTLLIATTLVAVGLGIIVAAT